MSTEQQGIPKTYKRPGWKLMDISWTKSSAHGLRYICAYCGREALGTGRLERNHRDDCPKFGEQIRTEREQREQQRRRDDLVRRAVAMVSAWDNERLERFLATSAEEGNP